MSKKGKANPVVRVRPSINKPRSTNAQIGETTKSSVLAMKASSDWSSAVEVQAAVAKWSSSADDVTANAAIIAQLKDQLMAAVSKQRTLRHTWSVYLKQVLASLDAFCANSPAKIQGFGCLPVSNTAHALLGAPTNLATSPGLLLGEARLTWARGLAIHGFIVQHATDTANPATYATPVPCSKVKFTLAPTATSPSGSTVYFRVAAIDPHAPLGQSPWSAWIAATVR
jgi:hypothetical protein